MSRERIAVCGLGKLGSCLAAVLADRGFDVLGFDVDRSKIDAINQGRSPIFEPGLDDLISSNASRIKATSDFEEAVRGCIATFVVVPTPSNRSGAFSLRLVKAAMEQIGEALAMEDTYHLVVVTSTVMPGSMDRIRSILEASSGKVCGKDFGLCYNPEFIALGNVIDGLLEPDFVLIGEYDRRSGGLLSRIQGQVCKNDPPIERMNFVNAELAKISVNAFVTMKMSFANTLAEMCEKLPGADVDTVTTAIGKDKRIGAAYLKGALGYGGPCFPRDNIAFARLAETIGAQARLAVATHEVNLRQVERIMSLVEGVVPPGRGTPVAILGLAYKPDTNIVEESQSMMLATRLRDDGFEVHVFDPVALQKARSVLGDTVAYHSSAERCISEGEICILATPWREFKNLKPGVFKDKVVVDLWRFLSREAARGARGYVPLGVALQTAKDRPDSVLRDDEDDDSGDDHGTIGVKQPLNRTSVNGH